MFLKPALVAGFFVLKRGCGKIWVREGLGIVILFV